MAKETVSQLDQALIDVINKSTAVGGEVYDGAKKATGQAIDFAMQQAPDLIHQLLLYHFVISLVWFVVGLLITLSSIYFGYVACKNYASKKWDDAYSPLVMFLIFPIGFGFTVISANTDWLKIWLAPKIYLLEYAANLLK
jgi:hypothetical protein